MTTLDYDEALRSLTAQGSRFETGRAVVGGQELTVFTNAAPSLQAVFDSARRRGDETCLVYEDERWSFTEVCDHVGAFASALAERYGVTKGDRVAIAARNLPEWIVAFGAVVSIGAVCVPLNAWWLEGELAHGLEDSGATVLVADPERVDRTVATCERLGIHVVALRSTDPLPIGDRYEDVVRLGAARPQVAVAADDVATILYTSGTTGLPKGAVATHGAITQALMGFGCRGAVDRARRPAAPGGDRPVFILVVPLFHVTGCIPVMLSSIASGLKLVMLHRWDADRALELIERERVTNFVGVPTQSRDLVESPRFAEFDTSSLRSVGGGGAPTAPDLVKKVAARVTTGRPTNAYGMTETNAYGPLNSGEDYLARPTSAGRATPILEIEVRDDEGHAVPVGDSGEIWFRGPHLISGYWQQERATADALVDGWLRTGDIGRVDDEGFVYVEDRAKDVVLRGGENVYCAEVEAAVEAHIDVLEVAVIGLPHERLGEEVCAIVVPNPGHALDLDELAAFTAARLAAFKVPSHWFERSSPLPRNAAGKVLKRSLKEGVSGSARRGGPERAPRP